MDKPNDSTKSLLECLVDSSSTHGRMTEEGQLTSTVVPSISPPIALALRRTSELIKKLLNIIFNFLCLLFTIKASKLVWSIINLKTYKLACLSFSDHFYSFASWLLDLVASMELKPFALWQLCTLGSGNSLMRNLRVWYTYNVVILFENICMLSIRMRWREREKQIVTCEFFLRNR